MTQPNEAKTSHPSPLQNSDKVIQNAGSEDSKDGCKGQGKYLGIDYGKAKIGLAIADGETRIAFVLATLENNKDFLPSLKEIVQKNNIDKIVIGMPAYNNRENVGYDSDSVKSSVYTDDNGARAFGKLLEKELDIEIEYQDEMFTTKMAHQNLVDKGAKNIKSQDDQEAARIILQSWLDKS